MMGIQKILSKYQNLDDVNIVFDCNVRIVDMVMGSGKTTAALRFMNESDKDERFIYINPFLSISENINELMEDLVGTGNVNRKFYSPKERYKGDTKLKNIKNLISKGYNISSTHALFSFFDRECIDLCRAKNYTLVMDEVANVIEEYSITKDDAKTLLEKYVDIGDDGILMWKEEANDYTGKFAKEKRLCDLGCLSYYGGSIMLWMFPIEAFNAFRNIYILTYMFDGQIQKYYYDFFHLPYKYIYIKGDSRDTYRFSEEKPEEESRRDYKKLIHICDNKKMNMIGDRTFDLSVTWYKNNKDNAAIKVMQNNLINFFRNLHDCKSNDTIWTTFNEYKKILTGKGYAKGFLTCNARSYNSYGDRHYVAYPINRFLDPVIKQFFIRHNVEVNEDKYALSEMIQFIWRSAIRNDKEIWLYVPSKRMREMLIQWLNEVS